MRLDRPKSTNRRAPPNGRKATRILFVAGLLMCVFGAATRAATALGKVTWLLAIAFICTSLTLTIIAAQNSAGSSVLDRIGVDAPRSVAVHREEVAAEIRQSNREAAQLEAVTGADLPRPAG